MTLLLLVSDCLLALTFRCIDGTKHVSLEGPTCCTYIYASNCRTFIPQIARLQLTCNTGSTVYLVGLVIKILATLNQHPPAHHPLDACHHSVMDEPQMS
jgi:hypothetical protein